MDYLVLAINMNWFWPFDFAQGREPVERLGPWLVISLGIGVVAQIIELVKDECQ